MKDTAKSKKNGKPKHVLDPLKVKAVEQAIKPGDIPIIRVAGDYPTRYNDAAAVVKDAEQYMKDLKPIMQPDALAEIFRHNSDKPWDPIASVKFQDDADSVLMVSFTAKYSPTTAAVAEALFKGIKTKNGDAPDINNYLTRTMVGKFDSTCFLGPDGKFDRRKYTAIFEALRGVAQQLGISNPLSTEETVIPMPDFHARRWMDFSVETNKRIAEEIKNQINFVPKPKAATGEEAPAA
jgi:hypothetical protein